METGVRAAVLFVGVLVCQLFNAIGFGIESGGMAGSLLMLIPLTGLGWLILSGSLLLPPILRRLVRPLRAERGISILSHWSGQLLSGTPAVMQRFVGAKGLLQTVKNGDGSSQGDIQMSEETTAAVVSEPRRSHGPNLDYVYKLSIVVLAGAGSHPRGALCGQGGGLQDSRIRARAAPARRALSRRAGRPAGTRRSRWSTR